MVATSIKMHLMISENRFLGVVAAWLQHVRVVCLMMLKFVINLRNGCKWCIGCTSPPIDLRNIEMRGGVGVWHFPLCSDVA